MAEEQSQSECSGCRSTSDDVEATLDNSEAISNDIIAMYDSGVPLFSKDILRQVGRQLKEYDEGLLEDHKIHVKNMKGEDVEITLNPDEPTGWVEWRCNHGDRRTKPYIFYRSIQKLIDQEDMSASDPQKACLAIGILFPDPKEHGSAHESTFFVLTLTKLFQATREDWEANNAYAQVKTLLKANQQQLSKVKDIVAFALGRLTNGQEFDYCCTYQHAFVLSIQRILSEMTTSTKPLGLLQTLRKALSKNKVDHPVEVYAQDPAYLGPDREVLGAAGITVLNDPNGFLQVGETSMLVSIAANVPIHQVIADIARPAAIIWDEHEAAINGPDAHFCADPSSPRVEKMLNDEYVRFKLPSVPHLRDLVLYIRRNL
ncbi:hypothetical protein GGS26DRAFT_599331 [Hypomontagnella submonticulosa]|nr:hypothetical protein GGS26DRAFT_599331 [Hypomontagnella submonticulosa]